ncbi:MAG: glycyl radical protein [candidate division Zixibacteria bacterium]|nr:glycyl radical protein [candidate division Zixibacteria bacterium]MDH3938752.1 glycyl radical protein [candidate division Zixibacteria bacterium]MDH4032805.1 glycyl radical protein [candidate division Zixibacteria bacterium]
MNDRIKRLRLQSLDATPRVSIERAVLLTEFYSSGKPQQVSTPVARALAFAYLLEHKTICINSGELIVGERGEAPKATPTYPEICTHSLDDLAILNDRPKISFAVSDEVRDLQRETVIPFWSGRSLRDRIFEEMDPDWKTAYDSGVFTEFQEQRAPGHTVLDDKIYHKGMLDFKADISAAIERLDFQYDPGALDKRDQLTAMSITTDALIGLANRHADELERLAQETSDAERKAELVQMTEICRRVPAHAPDSFWQALQYYWFVHLGVITELNTWDSFNPGRLDQHLLPFYQRDIASGKLTPERARELLQSFWIKFNNQPAPPKVGVTAQESNTYTDFCLINVGGVKPDGSDGANELSYLILDVIEEMRLLQPSSMVQIAKKSPQRLLMRALEIIKTGYGQPSLFNTDAIISELLRQGKTPEDARNGGASGCVEAGAFGKEAYILTGYFNIVKVLEITLHNGLDPRTGEKIGLETGDPASFETFDQFYAAFEDQLAHFIGIKIKGNLIIERLWAKNLPAPFLSVLVDDCIADGTDYNAGGARYNSSYLQGVGLGSVTDCLAAIKFHVFDHPTVTFPRLVNVLREDFANDPELQKTLQQDAPKYGNDDKYPDDLARRVFESYFGLLDGRPNTRGGHHRINLLPTTCHIYFGSVVGAMSDGRAAGVPLSEGISPVQGSDRQGPTAVMNSAAGIDHLRTGGTLLNMKFSPQLLQDQDGLDKLAHLVRTYFTMDGHHVQFNVVTAETLRCAQKEPHKHRDLIVRVAGYSDYFVDLTDALQDEIIRRTEQGTF